MVLRLQAHVDGQLPDAEAKDVAALLSRDERQHALHEELRLIKTLVRDHPIEQTVPESRDFYWSQIQRNLEPAPVGRAQRTSLLGWWLRWLLPLGATGLLCLYWLAPLHGRRDSPAAMLIGHEIETPLADTSSFSFRSEAAAMTVVWVETRGLHNVIAGK